MGASGRARHAAGARVLTVLGLALALAACSGSLDRRLAEVRDLHAASEFQASIEPLRDVLARDPDNAEANYLLGLALVQTGKPVLATTPLEKAAGSDDFGTPAGTLLAAVLASRQEHEAASRAAERVLARDPDNVMALQVRAASALRLGDAGQALEDARRAVASSPQALQARVLEAVALDRLGRADEAKEAEAQLAETAREVGQDAAEIRSCVMLALLHYELGDFERSSETFGQCLDRFPSEPFVLQQATPLYDANGRSDEASALWQRAIEMAPDKPILRYLLAERLLRLGRPDEAEVVLKAAADRFDDATSHAQLARFHQRLGRLDEAFADLEAARQAEASSLDLDLLEIELRIDRRDFEEAERQIDALESPFHQDLLRGSLLAARGEDAAALASLESAFARAPTNAVARYLAGSIAERLGQTEKAIFHFQQAIQLDPSATDAAAELATIWLGRGQTDEALAATRLALQTRPTSRARALSIAARCHILRGEFDEARETIDALAAIPGQKGRAVLEQALLASRTGGPEAVVRAIEASGLDLAQPGLVALLRHWAESKVSLGEGDAALAEIDGALERKPEAAPLHDVKARVLARLGRSEEARKEFREALRVDPGYGSALAGLGALAASEGNLEEAIALLDRANADRIGDVDSALLAASLVRQQGRLEETERRLRAILAVAPGQASALNDLAWTLARLGRNLDEALDLAERAAEISPSPETLDTLGSVRIERGEHSLAVASLERALALAPDASGTRYRLGVALEALGRTEEARAALERALAGEDFPEAEEARAALTRLGPA